MKGNLHCSDISVGVVGLGLMGSSIIVSLLMAGHRVIAVAPVAGEKESSDLRIREQLRLCAEFGALTGSPERHHLSMVVTEDYGLLKECGLVLECAVENNMIKEKVIRKISDAVTRDTIIASNTSAIPISQLQLYVSHPERFLGIHWAEPAYATRFLEIIYGDKSSDRYGDFVFELACLWGKEPTILKKDIRGFITNRLMYSMYREALHLVENKQATLENIDMIFKYDFGSWMTFMGLFKRMDFVGLKDYSVIFSTIFPTLNNDGHVPLLMNKLMNSNANGTNSLRGFFEYTPEEAKAWNDAFLLFNQEIFKLAALYPSARFSENENIVL